MIVRFEWRRGTTSEWSSINPILAVAEPGFNESTGGFKIGDGVTHWSDLPYQSFDAGQLDSTLAQMQTLADAAVAAASSAADSAEEASDSAGGAGGDTSTLMVKSANLSDVVSVAAARTNLGLGSAALLASTAFATPTDLSSAATDARNRVNHTGTQLSNTVSDFTEAAQDAVAAMMVAGSGITVTYNDSANTLTITSTGGGGSTDQEVVRDTIAAALVASGLITITVNDAADTITVGTTATANSTDATLLARANHTGTQAYTTITGLGGAATLNVGTTSGTVAAGNDTRITGAAPQTAVDAVTAALTTVISNTQTETTYTLALTDAGKAVEMNNAATNTVTIPTNASVAFPVGTVLEVSQYGAGQTTIAAASGVTLRAPDGAKLSKQYASASLRQRSANEWILSGSTTT